MWHYAVATQCPHRSEEAPGPAAHPHRGKEAPGPAAHPHRSEEAPGPDHLTDAATEVVPRRDNGNAQRPVADLGMITHAAAHPLLDTEALGPDHHTEVVMEASLGTLPPTGHSLHHEIGGVTTRTD